MSKIVMSFLAKDCEEFAEKLTDKMLSYVSPYDMQVRIEALRVELRSIASSLGKGT